MTTAGDTRPPFTGAVGVDVTGGSVEVHILRPDGTLLVRPATITTAATGAWSYTPADGELNVGGNYIIDAKATLADGGVATGDPQRNYVRPALTALAAPGNAPDPLIVDGGIL